MGPALMALLGTLALAPGAEESSAAAAVSEATPPQGERRLNLGPYGRPSGSSAVNSTTEGPRFESTVVVEAKAPPDYNATMAVWWRHFNFTEPAIYGRGIPFGKPPPPGSVNILPLVDWLAKKVKQRRSMPEE